jgi:hypothetical protein
VDVVAFAGVVPDECKAGITAAKLAAGGVDDAGSGSMNGVKFNLVQAFPQLVSPAVVDFVDCTLWAGPASSNPARQKSHGHQHPISIAGVMRRSIGTTA